MVLIWARKGMIRVGQVQAEIIKLAIEKGYKCFTPAMLGRELRERGLNIRDVNIFRSLQTLEARGFIKRTWKGVYCLDDDFVNMLSYTEIKVRQSGPKKK